MKRATALLIALLLLCSLLAGCTGTEQPQTTAEPDAPADEPLTAPEESGDNTADPGESEEPAAEIPVGKTGLATSPDPNNPAVTAEPLVLPLATDDPLVTFWMGWAHNDYPNGYADTLVPQEIYEATGVQVQIDTVSYQSATEQFNLMLVSGDTQDIICEIEKHYTKGAQHAIDDGAILDLTDYVAQYMPNYQAMRAIDDVHTRGTVTDEGRIGFIYGMSYQPEIDYQGMFIRQDLLDELGLALPETIDDWTECLRAMHNEWGGALSIPSDGVFDDSEFASAYGIGTGWYCVDREVRYGVVQPEFKDYLTLMRDWYAEGLIDQNFHDGSIFGRMGDRHEIVAFSFLWGLGGYNLYTRGFAAEDESPDMFFHGVQHAVLKKGDPVGHVCFKASAIREAAAVMPSAEDPVLCCRLLDYFFSEEGSLLIGYGPYGVSCEYDADGNVVMTQAFDDEVADNIATGKYSPGIAWETTFYKYAWWDWVFGIFRPERLLNQYDDLTAYNVTCVYWAERNLGDWNYPEMATLSTAEQEEYTRIYADAETMIAEQCAKIIVGMIDLDEGYEELLQMLDSIGFDKCIEYKQNAVDRYYAR